MDQLDNAVWHALTGPQARFSEGTSEARRFAPKVTLFGALPDDVGPANWQALADLTGAGGTAVLFRDEVDPPAGWNEVMRRTCLQMMAPSARRAGSSAVAEAAGAADEIVELGVADVDEMAALVKLTNPGPFARRTVELGRYLGVRRQGALVAMAGERFRIPGHTEISAVCTHPDHRGSGLAAALVDSLVNGIAARGDLAFLHVVDDNTAAIALYRALGFTTRREVVVTAYLLP